MRLLGLTTFLAVISMAVLGGEWELQRAKLSPDPAAGRELDGGALELRIPSKRACGWWTRTLPIDPAKGAVRFTARAEISLDLVDDQAFNDLMMYVTWNFPKDGQKRKGAFFQKDFIKGMTIGSVKG